MIDSALLDGVMYQQFLGKLLQLGCEVKQSKYLAFKLPDAERFIRAKSLGEDYTEAAIRSPLLG